MFAGKRTGTLSCGAVLTASGVLFLIHMFYPALTFSKIASFWPVVLILLGTEIIASYFLNGKNAMKYDFGAVVIILLMSLFSMCMGASQLVYSQFAASQLAARIAAVNAGALHL